MSPKEKHISDDAQRTSVCFTAEERAAIQWIREVRKASKSRRTTTNDIVVDALWYFLEKTQGITRDRIRQTLPPVPTRGIESDNKITQMPNPKKKS